MTVFKAIFYVLPFVFLFGAVAVVVIDNGDYVAASAASAMGLTLLVLSTRDGNTDDDDVDADD